MNPPNYRNQDLPCCANCYYRSWDGSHCSRFPLSDEDMYETGICDDYQKDE